MIHTSPKKISAESGQIAPEFKRSILYLENHSTASHLMQSKNMTITEKQTNCAKNTKKYFLFSKENAILR